MAATATRARSAPRCRRRMLWAPERVCQMIMTRLKVEKRPSLVLCRVIHARILAWEARMAMPSRVGARTVATSFRAKACCDGGLVLRRALSRWLWRDSGGLYRGQVGVTDCGVDGDDAVAAQKGVEELGDGDNAEQVGRHGQEERQRLIPVGDLQ